MIRPCLLLLHAFAASSVSSIYQSYISFSPMGVEFLPVNNIQLLLSISAPTKLRCSSRCNQMLSCRTFDFDFTSKRCRLFDADLTTGSTILSSSATSIVGTVRISSSLYSSINQSCAACPLSRYEICSMNTSTCQCPPNTYWRGNHCALQAFENETCSQIDACRSDLNLTCSSTCYGEFVRCQKLAYDSKLILSFEMMMMMLITGFFVNGSTLTSLISCV